ncbi:hypothetical protein F3Y22_tig00110213pilonHSYRG00188 [Hibiscus syriacus]|uniref:Uncharacterized protein n=1 Tax=Hibiscus syriacus TaxID=106335 RepID=A0A6A3BCB7_HIBSY|nr:hypothetical protein F3Y22_tig00110213pilonHSYRG00188 [Hibiscus syriacus]
MASLLQLLSVSLLIICCSSASADQTPKHYVVYMGSSAGETAESEHLQLLSTVIPRDERERIYLTNHYNHALRGFSAMLTDNEASELSGREGIVSVFADPILQLHTTRSWDFLDGKPNPKLKRGSYPPHQSSYDVIIGMIDGGIWPESPSFRDEGMGEIPTRWKGVCMEGADRSKMLGVCMEGPDFKNSDCNRKLIGARCYNVVQTSNGNTTATQTRLDKSPRYVLKTVVPALTYPIAIGAFHAEQMGVMVVCSGGNEGPDPYTIINAAAWIFTVGASNIDRDFKSSVLLGNGRTFQGSAINFSNLTRTEAFPLAYGKAIAAKYSPVSEARSCYPGSLDPEKVKGKMIICFDSFPVVSRGIKKLVAEDAGAKGLSQNWKHKPAPVVAYFSSRGPSLLTENILKPDVMAPGVAILAAVVPKVEEWSTLFRRKPSGYAIKSGTSTACPHVTGASAFVKSVHPTWTASMIRSPLMTTATVYDNMEKPLTNSSGSIAIPHETGAGEIIPLKALNPGIVFETTSEDYLRFLCYYGYPEKTIRSMSKTNFKCPRKPSDDLISGINYPSVSISRLARSEGFRTIKRTITNVGLPNATYTSVVQAPMGMDVKVSPKKITFVESVKKISFKVRFDGREASTGYNFGTLTWSAGSCSVRMVFAVNVV